MEVEKIKQIVEAQERWRNACVNLIPSENVMLEEAKDVYANDFMHRYAEGKPGERYYQGTKYIDTLEEETVRFFQAHFNAKQVEIRPISGAMANLFVFSALLNKGKVISNSLIAGGHLTHSKISFLGLFFHAEVMHFPKLEENPFFIDVDKTIEMIRKENPDFVVFGRSLFLFPEPIKEIRKEFPELTIVYDAAHVFGLIFQGEFQDPFKEGADVITASTHKTFPGPQGGIVISKIEMEEKFIFPGLVSNHHLHRIPALLVTAILLKTKYSWYSKQVIKNAKAFAEALYNLGFDVVCPEHNFTESHQVVVDVKKLGGGKKVARKLEEENIIVNANALPYDKGFKEPSGIRMGTQEMTLKGWKEEDFEDLARRMKKILL